MKPFRRDSSAARSATALLAVLCIIVLGLAACSTIVVSATDRILLPLLLCLSIFSALGYVCYRMVTTSDRPATDRALGWLSWHRDNKPKATYQLKKLHRITPEMEQSRQPPTVESVRMDKETFARWVPASNGRTDRGPSPSQVKSSGQRQERNDR